MKLETDLKRIKKLAGERENENIRFRTFLKGSDSEELDALVHSLSEEISKQIECCSCGNCCREMVPLVSISGRKRLAAAKEMAEDEFTEKYLVEDKLRASHRIKSTPCPFLSENKCTVYDSRPSDCRSYPHLHKPDFVFRLWGVINNYEICPIVFNVFERLKDKIWR